MNIGSYSNNSDMDIDISGLTKDNDDEASMTAVRILRDDVLSRYPRVKVEGHGEYFRAEDVRMVLISHFSVCGVMYDVVIPTNPQSEYPVSIALISQSFFLVEGYPSWLPVEVVRSALFRVFRSCGEIIYVNIREDKPGVLNSCGSIRLWGEDAKQKAAQLDGTDMGGWSVVVITGPTRPARLGPEDRLTIGWDGPPGHRWGEYKPKP